MRRERLIGLTLAVVTAAVYGQVAGFDFVNFDDPNYVIENPHVIGGLSVGNIGWALTAGYEANWHPATWWSLMLDAQLFGLNAGGYHLTSLLLHILSCLLLFGVLRRMTGRCWPSAFVAGLLALHPLHVESVAWVTERKDVLSLFWGLLSLWAYVAYCRSGRRSWYALCGLCLAVGLMAKPMLVTLPLLFLLLDYWPLNRLGRRSLLEKLPLLALVAASAVATFLAQSRQGAVSDVAAVSLTDRLANAVVSYVRYLGKMIWPQDLSILYPHPNLPGGTPWAAGQVLGALLLLLAISGLVFRFRCHRFLTVGWLWYLGSMVPMIGIVQVGTQAMADRYTYLPLIGIYIALAWSGALLAERASAAASGRTGPLPPRAGARIVIATAAIILLACAGATWSQTRVWRDSETLGRHAIESGPTGPKIHYNLGLALSKQGRYAEAVPHYQDAIRLQPDHAKAHNNLGRSLQKLDRLDEAIASIERALAIDPDFELAYINLSDALAAANHLSEAIRARQEALRLNPNSAPGHSNLGTLLARAGRLDEAIAHFRRALEIAPGFAGARQNLQIVLEMKESGVEGK